MIGGESETASQSVEFWSAADPEQGSCVLKELYPRLMSNGPTVNLVSGRLVACYDFACEIYQEGLWRHLQNTTVSRMQHSSARTEEAILLIGGECSNTTEWIPMDDESAAADQLGTFTVQHGDRHCTIQLREAIRNCFRFVRTFSKQPTPPTHADLGLQKSKQFRTLDPTHSQFRTKS